jgi:hypothetical protein
MAFWRRLSRSIKDRPMGKQVLICNDCRERIPFDDGQWPDSCPGCGRDTSLPVTDEVALPAFISPRKAATDKVYRDMERASEVRAQAAADVLGVPVSDMSALKITDLHDRGEPPVNNSVTQQMEAMRQRGMPTGFGAQIDFGAVSSGPSPNAGAHTRVRLQRALPPVAMAPEPLEVNQPGYRRRA